MSDAPHSEDADAEGGVAPGAGPRTRVDPSVDGAPRAEPARERARSGVRVWVREIGRRTVTGARKATPYGILGFLAASAMAPVAAPALGGGAEFGAALNQLGGMGGNYLAEVMMQTAGRLRDDREAAGPITTEEWRDALAAALGPRLQASDEQGRELRPEVARVL